MNNPSKHIVNHIQIYLIILPVFFAAEFYIFYQHCPSTIHKVEVSTVPRHEENTLQVILTRLLCNVAFDWMIPRC